MLLWRILDAHHHQLGTYVEVGSNHPWKHSNTAFFYERGWSGIAIDPNPEFASLFSDERPRDTFLNLGISDEQATLTYYQFPQSLYNTFSKKRAASLVERRLVPEPETDRIRVVPLGDALRTVWPLGRDIDLLSIDAEGLDLRIVEAHDFESFPASFLIVEFDSVVIGAPSEQPLIEALVVRDFIFISKLWKSGLFVHRAAAEKLGLGL